MSTCRIGRKLGRTLYRDEVCVGMVDTREIAKAIVDAMNGSSGRSHCGRDPAPVGCCGGTDATCSCECNTCMDPR